MFPKALEFPVGERVNDFVDWLVVNYGDFFESVANTILWVLVRLERLLRWLPWWVLVILVVALAFHASRRKTLAIGMGVAMVLIGALGLWDMAMQTLALMLVACGLSVLIGLPVGILMSGSDRLRAFLLPVLDAMQTLPSFVYLVPVLMLFGLGKVPAIFATIIYAVPPLIRLTDLGIRLVDKEVMEASYAFGANSWQRLFGVQLPLAKPNIMAGVNQTTMMALAMVVIASMIGARGLGEQVLLGIQRLDVGQGMQAGVAIVALAIVFDRISQAYGEPARPQKTQ